MQPTLKEGSEVSSSAVKSDFCTRLCLACQIDCERHASETLSLLLYTLIGVIKAVGKSTSTTSRIGEHPLPHVLFVIPHPPAKL